MMNHLFHKEFRHLVPLAVFFALFLCFNMVEVFTVDGLLQTHWYSAHPGFDSGYQLFSTYVMGVSFAYSLYPREYEERTIEFLHTLPITRRQIFWSKCGAAMTWMALLLGLVEVGAFLLQALNHDSLTASNYSLVNSAILYGLGLCAAMIGLAHGLFLSLLRQFGVYLIIFGLFFMEILEKKMPSLKEYLPSSLIPTNYHGAILDIPWSAIVMNLSISALCLLLAERLWSRRGHQLTALILVKFKKWPKLVGCLSVLLFSVFMVVIALNFDEEEESYEPQPRWESARTLTAHYAFTFPINLRDDAIALTIRADAIYEKAFQHLGDPETDSVIMGDLTDVSNEHLGIAAGELLRMDLTDSTDPALLDQILCHETCHVLANRLSGRRGLRYHQYLSAFHEGTATYFSYELCPTPQARENSRRTALATQEIYDIDLEDLFDSTAFNKRVDSTAAYTLGEIWVAALVDAYGETAPKKLWQVTSREAANDLEPEIFWRDTCQAAGFSFERIRAAWDKRISDLKISEAEFLESLPEVSVRADYDEEQGFVITAKASKDFPDAWPGFVIWIRDPNSLEPDSLLLEDAEESKTAKAVVPDWYGDEFDFRVGVQISKGTYPILHEWRPAPKR